MSSSTLLFFCSKLDLEYNWLCRTLVLQKTCIDKYSSLQKKLLVVTAPSWPETVSQKRHLGYHAAHPQLHCERQAGCLLGPEGTTLPVLEPFRSSVQITLHTGGPFPRLAFYDLPGKPPIPFLYIKTVSLNRLQRGWHCHFKKWSKYSQRRPLKFTQKYLHNSSWAHY